VYVYTNARLMAKAKAKDEKRWYEENVSSEDSDSDPEEDDGDDWMDNPATDNDEDAYHPFDDSMDDWNEFPNEERSRPFSSRHGESSRAARAAVYDFVGNEELENYVQASIENNSCRNSTERANDVRELIEEEGNDIDEADDTIIGRMREGISNQSKDVDLETRNVEKSTMGNTASVKGKTIEEKFGPISKSPLKFTDQSLSRFEDQIDKTTVASRSLFDNAKTSTSKVPLPSSLSSMKLVSLSKEVHGRIGESDADSESDGNLPLAAAIIRRHSGVPRRHNHRLSDKRMHTGKATDDLILSPSVDKIGSIADGNRKRRRPMQPFAISPPKREVRVKTPLDAKVSMAKIKCIQPRLKETKGNMLSPADDDESCDFEESSRAEVKGDSDYKED
jgi:hypothetical protein